MKYDGTMKIGLISFFAFFCLLSAEAQERIGNYTARLRTPDVATGAQAVVSNDGSVSAALRSVRRKDRVTGYRICIFFDNTQEARSRAYGALATFKSRFPGIPGEVIYDNPTFRTMVGYCMDMTEVSMLLGRVREFFPKAVVRGETMAVSQLRHSPIIGGGADDEALTTEEGDSGEEFNDSKN